jgi:hypothetical protein
MPVSLFVTVVSSCIDLEKAQTVIPNVIKKSIPQCTEIGLGCYAELPARIINEKAIPIK